MNLGNGEETFWNGLENRIEKMARDGLTGKSKIPGILLAPVSAFLHSYIFKANFLKGRNGYREAVYKAILVFSVNARIYELNNADTEPLERIKKEWD